VNDSISFLILANGLVLSKFFYIIKIFKMIIKFINIKKRFGFTALEAVIGVSVIAMGLLGVSSLVIQNIQVQIVNRNYLISSMLAQEGLELVRNTRDKNWITPGNNWDEGIVGDFAIDYLGNIISVTGIDDPNTNLEVDNEFYCHDNGVFLCNGTDSSFARVVSIRQVLINLGPEYFLAASSTVRWQGRSKTYDYTAETNLYDWK
jgi:hypothetical protein